MVERKGSWYSRGDLRFAQGRRPAAEFLKSNAAIAKEVEDEVRLKLAAKVVRPGNARRTVSVCPIQLIYYMVHSHVVWVLDSLSLSDEEGEDKQLPDEAEADEALFDFE